MARARRRAQGGRHGSRGPSQQSRADEFGTTEPGISAERFSNKVYFYHAWVLSLRAPGCPHAGHRLASFGCSGPRGPKQGTVGRGEDVVLAGGSLCKRAPGARCLCSSLLQLLLQAQPLL